MESEIIFCADCCGTDKHFPEDFLSVKWEVNSGNIHFLFKPGYTLKKNVITHLKKYFLLYSGFSANKVCFHLTLFSFTDFGGTPEPRPLQAHPNKSIKRGRGKAVCLMGL